MLSCRSPGLAKIVVREDLRLLRREPIAPQPGIQREYEQ
jgi:hypothetical protein